ncbi:MAG: hypothetical protein Q7R33_04370 [Nitrosarchaeum sp.]|nr:hypothetical protein [Nitrosarchaeum sp.]
MNILERFEKAVRNHEMRGSKRQSEIPAIENEYEIAKSKLIEILPKEKMSRKSPQLRNRKTTALERSMGRSKNYWQKSNQEQWAEDKALGILDWDGKCKSA